MSQRSMFDPSVGHCSHMANIFWQSRTLIASLISQQSTLGHRSQEVDGSSPVASMFAGTQCTCHCNDISRQCRQRSQMYGQRPLRTSSTGIDGLTTKQGKTVATTGRPADANLVYQKFLSECYQSLFDQRPQLQDFSAKNHTVLWASRSALSLVEAIWPNRPKALFQEKNSQASNTLLWP